MPTPTSHMISGPTGSKPSGSVLHIILAIAGWSWGVICVFAGLASIVEYPGYAVLMIVMGLLVIPPIWRLAMRSLGRPLSLRYTLLPGIIALVPIAVLAGREGAARKAEEARQAEVAAENRRNDSLFLAAHPTVDSTAYAEWKAKAQDSVNNMSLGLGSFLVAQDSVQKQRAADSIVAEKTRRQDSIKGARAAYQAELESKRAEQRAAAATKRAAKAEKERYEPDTYNGHQVFTGPRGGRYYINSNGKKTYI